MKTPRFEELAQRWAGKAQVYFVFSDEAHPHAAADDKLNGFATHLASLDANGDNEVTLAEYGSAGPRYMFDAFDLDHDGVVKSHELLAARRIGQFKDVDDAKTIDERVALAKRFRSEVPGAIPVLIDPIDNRTSKAYGGLPNSAYVIGGDGKVALKLAWASVHDVDVALAKLTGAPPPPSPPPADLAPIAKAMASATAAHKRVLVELVSPGCPACERMEATTLKDADVVTARAQFEVVHASIEHDDTWRLFEQLDLAATPAFVIVDPERGPVARMQGYQDKAATLAFLAQK